MIITLQRSSVPDLHALVRHDYEGAVVGVLLELGRKDYQHIAHLVEGRGIEMVL